MCTYICLAGMVFLGVILWRAGLIFKDVDDSVSAVQGSGNSDGYDELGRMVCNGLTLNCHRRANEIMYATVHNAMSSREHNFLAYNNLLPLEDALRAGFRGLTLDSCDCSRVGIQLCHGLCLAGFRRPVETFMGIVDFMEKNPHEVVVMEVEVGDESLGPLFDELEQVEGLFDLMYHHPGGDAKWPKLKDMIEMNKRLIIFAHDDTACEQGECPAGVHPTYDFAFATPFSQKSATGLMAVDETCSVNRGWSDSDFVISNHFATNDQGLPDINEARVTNSAMNLQLRLNACQEKFSTKYGQDVINLLVVDFWNIGDTVDVVHQYNSALPAMTDAPSVIPSSAPTLSPQPTVTPSPTSVDGPAAEVLQTAAPSLRPATVKPTLGASAAEVLLTAAPSLLPNTEKPTLDAPAAEVILTSAPSLQLRTGKPTLDAPAAEALLTPAPSWRPTTGKPTLAPTKEKVLTSEPTLPTSAPSAKPSISLESFFDTILFDPEAETVVPSEVQVPSNLTALVGSSPNASVPSLEAPLLSVVTPDSTTTVAAPTSAPNVAITPAPTLATTLASTSTLPILGATVAPTFGPTREESLITPQAEKEQPEASQPEVEKERPGWQDDTVLSSAFGEETPSPTEEGSSAATADDNPASHHVFAMEKDPSP